MRFLPLLLAAVLGACSSKQLIPVNDETVRMTPNPVLYASVAWVKAEAGKYDFELVLRNQADVGIIIFLGEMQCYRGERPGTLKHTFFNTGERTIDLRSGEAKELKLVCRHGEGATGDFRVKFPKVYANPNNDGATTGKVIARDLLLAIARGGP
jgi:hypothetical protein